MTRSCHPHHGVPPGRRAAVGARCRPGSGVRPAQPPAHPRLRRLRCRGDADFPQVTQKRDHRAPAQRPPAASRLPGRQKRRHRVLVELNRFQPRARHPHADLAQILQHVPHRRGRVASIRQPRPVALDLRTQPAGLPPRTRHRDRALASLAEHSAPDPRLPSADTATRPIPAAGRNARSPPSPGHRPAGSRPCRHSHAVGIDRPMRMSA